MNSLTSKVFINGNSQAVRIPAQFRLDAKEVQIFQNSEGDLVIHPITPTEMMRGDALFSLFGKIDVSWIAAVEEARAEILPMQDRDEL